jgi:hypothetical protein
MCQFYFDSSRIFLQSTVRSAIYGWQLLSLSTGTFYQPFLYVRELLELRGLIRYGCVLCKKSSDFIFLQFYFTFVTFDILTDFSQSLHHTILYNLHL